MYIYIDVRKLSSHVKISVIQQIYIRSTHRKQEITEDRETARKREREETRGKRERKLVKDKGKM